MMIDEHWTDTMGRPAGGITQARGFTISWQNGPLGRHKPGCESEGCKGPDGPSPPGCTRVPANGAFVEDVIVAAIVRLEFYQQSEFECAANADALMHLGEALAALSARTADREARCVEGTHAA